MKQRYIVMCVLAAACTRRADKVDQGADPMTDPGQQPIPAVLDDHGAAQQPVGYIGVLTPRESVDVSAVFTTTVAEMKVKLGDRVDKGQELARLDDRPLRQQLAIEQATLRANQADVASSDIEHHAALAALDREKRALRETVASQADVSAAEFNARKEQMTVARASANVEEQRAKIAALTARLTDTTLVAPLAGRVALLYAREGERVEEGHPVIRVISSDELFVKFAIPSDKVGTVVADEAVDIVIEAQGVTTKGIVRHVAPELDPITQMILADAELVAPPVQLQSGVVVRVVPPVVPAGTKPVTVPPPAAPPPAPTPPVVPAVAPPAATDATGSAGSDTVVAQDPPAPPTPTKKALPNAHRPSRR